MATEWVLGFDLSLSAPAAVAMPLNWRPGDWGRVKTWLTHPAPPKSDDLKGQMIRYALISDWACGVVRETSVQCSEIAVYVESYGFSKNNAQASRLMESGGIVKHELYKRHRLIATPVQASAARKLFLGYNPGKDPKVVVQDVLFNQCKAPKDWDENQADAFVVCNFGLSEMSGKPIMMGLIRPAPGSKAAQRRKPS
jgi:hypothetical protein